MMEKKASAVLIDIDYISREGKSIVRLLLKGKRFFRLYDENFEPYFYLDAPISRKEEILGAKSSGKGPPGKVTRIEGAKMKVAGKEKTLLKVFCSYPSAVPSIRESLRQFPAYEFNIPYARRYLMDKGLSYFSRLSYVREGKKLLRIVKVSPDPDFRLNTLAFDIETYNPQGVPRAKKDPVIMVSYATREKARVLTFEKIPLDFVDVKKTEEETLASFSKVLSQEDVELLVGYNSSVFDIPYLSERSRELGTELALGRDLSSYKERKFGMRTTAKIAGRIHVDLYHVIRFMGIIGALRMQRYGLGDAYKEVMGKESRTKALVQKLDIWKLWDGSPEERKLLAEYSKNDALETLEICEKVLPLQIALSKTAKQSLFEVSSSTAGQLVESLLMYRSVEEGAIIPGKPEGAEVKEREREPIQGAFVKIPTPGIYENLAVFDFRGLYPSIICSHNIDPFTLLSKGTNETDAYTSPLGHKFSKKSKGLIPLVLEEIIKVRTELKHKLKKLEPDSEEYVQAFAKSQALKVIANSYYGYLAYARSRWYSRECAESVTAWGRHYIQETISKAEKEGLEVLYGDSVTSERFVTVLSPDGLIRAQNIEELFEKHKEKAEKRGEKEAIRPDGYKALTLDPETRRPSWKPILEIIRHKTDKKIFRISQKYGETRVTEDHSVMVEEAGVLKEAKPEELKHKPFVKINSIPPAGELKTIDIYELLKPFSYPIQYKGREKEICADADSMHVSFNWEKRKNPVQIKRFISTGTPEFEALCRLLGAYIPEGSSSTPETTKTRWGASIASSDKEWLAQLQKDYCLLFLDAKACIIPSMRKVRDLTYQVGGLKKSISYQDDTCKLQMMNKLAAMVFKAFCGQKSTGKKLPDFIFNVPEKYKLILLEQMVKGDGSHSVNPRLGYSAEYMAKNFKYTTQSIGVASGLSLLLTQLGRNHYVTYRPAKKAYTLGTSDKPNGRFVTKLLEEPYSGYVYDLSVEGTHTFADSCGQVLLHNTDSIFLVLGKNSQKDALSFMEKVNKSLPGNMELELEGFFPRGVFVTKKVSKETKGAKKKYALIDEKGRIKIRGFELVRRDWSKVAKETQRSVLMAILKEGSKEKAVKIVKDIIEKLRSGSVPIEDLTILTQLQKDPGSYDITSPELSAAQKAIKKGVRLEKGSLIGYVITKRGSSISDKAQIAEFAQDYDAEYYITRQILPSVLKILSELGYSEDDLKFKGSQSSLKGFFG